ncbi:MAG TPA: tetratricopeptide repeat protein [Gemmatimonadales bacterium]|nr:tetratricopeptide repeat protein [Gemmatimonadales bacterium]HRZ09850.1 tetratricopeptide repeat protein [Gemmatimonadales bacterium]
MIRRIAPVLALATVALGGCALRSDVRRLEEQLTTMQDDNDRRDSLRAAQLTQILALQQRTSDSLAAVQASLLAFRGETLGQLYDVQKQILQVQELTGQSTRRLNELRGDLDARGQQLGGAAPAAGGAANASAVQMYEASLQQLRRGSPTTARAGFRQFLEQYPTAAEAPDALYFIGESFGTEAPDSAAAYYTKVADQFPASTRAASALYRLGAMAESARDTTAARGYYQRLISKYPTSNEAALARDRLKALGQ